VSWDKLILEFQDAGLVKKVLNHCAERIETFETLAAMAKTTNVFLELAFGFSARS
jgi:hypothetical protein